jgi:hypothetical protein
MALRETLQRVLTEYLAAKTTPSEGNALAAFIRGDAETSAADALGGHATGLVMKGSPGQGVWAEVPGSQYLTPRLRPAPPAAIMSSICFTRTSRRCTYR